MTAKGQWFLPATSGVLGTTVVAHDMSTKSAARCGLNVAGVEPWSVAKHCGVIRLCAACLRCAAYDRRGAELLGELARHEEEDDTGRAQAREV